MASNDILKNLVPQQILQRGVSLDALGLDEVGWRKNDALEILQTLSVSNIAILGGDVYRRAADSWRATGDSWYCNHRPDESYERFALRSQEKAEEYIRAYSPDRSRNSLFVLVVSTKTE